MRITIIRTSCRLAACRSKLPQSRCVESTPLSPRFKFRRQTTRAGVKCRPSHPYRRRQGFDVIARATDAPTEALPTPTIKIDNQSDAFATIVKVDFGDRLGELVDTIQALKNMGYNITRAKLSEESKNKFYITKASTSEKVTKSAELEDIRQCIIHNMEDYHPETKGMLATSGGPAPSAPGAAVLGAKAQPGAPTAIKLNNSADSQFTRLDITTRDRPGLLVNIVRTLKDCNVNVISAEVDTIGNTAQDEFMLMYHGERLNRDMRLLVKNALQYYLALAEIETEESY